MPIQQTLGIIGMGAMATAIISRALEAKVLSKERIIASEIDPHKQKELTQQLGFPCDKTLQEVCNCDIILIAVKPQNLNSVLEEMAPFVTSKNLLLSIVTGFTTQTISDKLANKGRILRVMPNTPVMVGKGVSALCKGPFATEEDLLLAHSLFSALGTALIVPEEQMDSIAALSGSGPAYFFYFVECLIEAGVACGLSRELSYDLAIQTCIGSAEMLKNTPDPQVLRKQVTSPGGSTAAAIHLFMENDLNSTVSKALQAAIKRNQELGS